jgi:hypothetical protein
MPIHIRCRIFDLDCPDDVGGNLPNELGIFDMSGGLMERCWDLYGNLIRKFLRTILRFIHIVSLAF